MSFHTPAHKFIKPTPDPEVQNDEDTFSLDDDKPLACPMKQGPDEEPCEACQ